VIVNSRKPFHHKEFESPREVPEGSDHPKKTAAIMDRLTFGGKIIETGTESYCLAHTRAKRAAARD
jgi:hypothetical protein